MINELKKVREFHEIFLHPVADKPTTTVNEVLRYKLMSEENLEYLEAATNKDLVGIADALGDQLYILCGTIVAHGMQDLIVDVFNEIHDSNMTKLGADGKPVYREDGKITKGPLYKKPEISQFFK
jgi:predicted HAD superfamily Cof-like phosphohydrolase